MPSQKQKSLKKTLEAFSSVPGEGVEPSRPKGHMALNHACLPIPAPGLLRILTANVNKTC